QRCTARSSAWCFADPERPRKSAQKLRNPNTDMSLYIGAFSGKYPIRLLVLRGCSMTSKPQTVTLPSVGARKPVIIRMLVDLPAPFGPRKPRTSPFSTENDRLSTASFGPKLFV